MNHTTMKELPLDARPYERCLREGPEHLSDAQLLSIIIRTGSKEESSLELASKILALNYPREGILGLLHLSLPQDVYKRQTVATRNNYVKPSINEKGTIQVLSLIHI